MRWSAAEGCAQRKYGLAVRLDGAHVGGAGVVWRLACVEHAGMARASNRTSLNPNPYTKMARPAGFEPATCGLKIAHSEPGRGIFSWAGGRDNQYDNQSSVVITRLGSRQLGHIATAHKGRTRQGEGACKRRPEWWRL